VNFSGVALKKYFLGLIAAAALAAAIFALSNFLSPQGTNHQSADATASIDALVAGTITSRSDSTPKEGTSREPNSLGVSSAGLVVSEDQLRDLASQVRSALQAKPSNENSADSVKDRLSADQLTELALLSEASELNDVRVSEDFQGLLDGLYLSIPLPSGESASLESYKENITQIVSEYPVLMASSEDGGLSVSEASCGSVLCSVKAERTYKGFPVWDYGVSFSITNGKLIAVQGLLKEPTLFESDFVALEPAEFRSVLAAHYDVEIDQIQLLSQLEEGIGRYGAHDFFGSRAEVSVSGGLPLEVYVSNAAKRFIRETSLYMEESVASSGKNLKDETVTFNSDFDGSNYRMIDSSFPGGAYTSVYDHSLTKRPNGELVPFPIGNREVAPLIMSSQPNANWDAAAVSALHGVKDLFGYFSDSHGFIRSGDETPLEIYVNGDYSNAIAGGNVILFGAGNGVTEKNFASAKDIIAHEVTHSVIRSPGMSDLEYKSQSGALNESLSDFFGNAVGDGNWILAEDLFVEAGQFIRHMASPNLGRALNKCGFSRPYAQPAHMSQYVPLPPIKECDKGGVHINSGIPNRMFYLLAEGLSEEGLGTSIGLEKTGKLAYALAQGLKPQSASFENARDLMYQTAQTATASGFTAEDAIAVDEAWKAVGVPYERTTLRDLETGTPEKPTANTMLYLYPNFDTSIFGTASNSFALYAQVYSSEAKEFVADTNFGPLNEYTAAFSRPTLIMLEDGSFRLLYKDTGGVFNVVTFKEGTITSSRLQVDGLTFSDVTLSTDGKYLAFTLVDSPNIYVLNLEDDTGSEVTVRRPSYTEGFEGIPASYIDTVRFDPTGRKIVFDYLVCEDESDPDCSEAGARKFWSIGILDAQTMELSFPFPKQNARFDVGFPTFSNLSENYLAFDIIDRGASTDSGVLSFVAVYDIAQKTVDLVALTDITTNQTGFFGTPSFTADDSGIIHTARFDSVASRIYLRELTDYLVPDLTVGNTMLNPYQAFRPISVPSVFRDQKPNLGTGSTELAFGDIEIGTDTRKSLCLTNSGEFPITIREFSGGPEGLYGDHIGITLSASSEFCGDVAFDTGSGLSGAVSTTFSIVHDGGNSPTPISVSAHLDADTDSDGVLNYKDDDDDGDGVADTSDAFPLDSEETLDTDSDGVGNNADVDDDGDGIADSEDAFPLDESESLDTDSDGVGNNADPDDDNDEILDADDAFPLDASESLDTDLDGVGNNADTDDDNDGVPDLQDAFALDATESVDTDADGIGNNLDTDDDNDGTLDAYDAFPLDETESVDTDSDGVGDKADTDDDADGVLDEDDAFPLDETESVDTDSDGVGNNADKDDDGDGTEDDVDAFPLDAAESLDTDSDGVGDNADTDDDDDGVEDSSDAFPLDAAESLDTDSDGIGNNADKDDDGDGTEDDVDAFPLDAAESLDTDSDGVGDNADTDDDDDGVEDSSDAFPLDATESIDTDADGVGNNADSDDDGDSLSDDDEGVIGTNPLVSDTDQDGVDDGDDFFPLDSAESADTDLDGVGDNADAFPFDATEIADADGDGFGDNIDLFDDDPFESLDTDLDGIGNNADLDDDNDGFTDEEELADGTNPLSRFSCRQGCFSFDVDENREAKALTDGLLVIRHLFGFTGDALATGAISTDATRDRAEDISALLADADSELDIDGNGESKALTDGLLLIRYLFGFTGDALTSGAIGDGATRETSEAIEAYISDRVPVSE